MSEEKTFRGRFYNDNIFDKIMGFCKGLEGDDEGNEIFVRVLAMRNGYLENILFVHRKNGRFDFKLFDRGWGRDYPSDYKMFDREWYSPFWCDTFAELKEEKMFHFYCDGKEEECDYVAAQINRETYRGEYGL